MRAANDVPRLASYGAGDDGREPGADKDFPPCSCGEVTLGVEEVRGLDEAGVLALLEARCRAVLHRCKGWPARRREPPGSVQDGPTS